MSVPRATTSSDVFNAVAEPQRRAILDFLAPDERPVADIVAALELAQPSVSKHLQVLRDERVAETCAVRNLERKWRPAPARQRLTCNILVVRADELIQLAHRVNAAIQ